MTSWLSLVSDSELCPVKSETINIDAGKNNTEFVILFGRWIFLKKIKIHAVKEK